MATLTISEYAQVATDAAGYATVVAGNSPIATQTVPILCGVPQRSATLNASTRLVRLVPDSPCSVLLGIAPDASQVHAYMPANTTGFYAVPAASGFKVSVIQNPPGSW